MHQTIKKLNRSLFARIWVGFCFRIKTHSVLLLVKTRYYFVLQRIKRKIINGQKLRVVFLVENISKWKTQSLFDEMKHSAKYEPIVVITRIDDDNEWKYYQLKTRFREIQNFFKLRGCVCELGCDVVSGIAIDLSVFSPDMVFFQEPYMTLHGQRVFDVSKVALCFYMPYGVEYEKANFTQNIRGFHDLLFANFVWNQWMLDYCKAQYPQKFRVGHFVNVGHTIFDELQNICNEENMGYVIYAPHFSFPAQGVSRGYMVSTFMWSGMPILAYAKKHPEIKWVFKPHPRLRSELQETGGWTQRQVEDYYSAWEKIGVVCYTSEYTALFRQSRALITDCGSFLIEYAITQKPILHLRLSNTNVDYRESVKSLIASFYQIRNLEEMFKCFKIILEEGEDPNNCLRIEQVKALDIIGSNASQRVLEYIDGIVSTRTV